MADVLSQSQRHKNMIAIHSVSTKPELKLRHALWKEGFRYRINDRRLPGKPDIVLAQYRTVIFVNGCFWHGHSGCNRFIIPQTNTEFWTSKIHRNQERDQDNWRKLIALGWNVIIAWECELKGPRFADTFKAIKDELRQNFLSHQIEEKERKDSRKHYLEEQKRKQARSNLVLEELNHTE